MRPIGRGAQPYRAGALIFGLLCRLAVPAGAGEPTLLRLTGAGAAAGDRVSATGGMNDDVSRFFVEVPSGQQALVIELFDADVLMTAGEPDEIDLANGGVGDTKVRYELYDPTGQPVATRFVTADNEGPVAADRAWLTFFSSRTASAPGERFADSFASASYVADDGSRSFSGPWIESGNTAGSGFDSGAIQIYNGRLAISNRGDVEPWLRQPSIERELDLSGFAAANLAFDFVTGPGVDFEDSLLIELSSDGGASFHVIEELIGLGGGESGRRIYDVSDWVSPRTRIRFRVGRFYAGPDESFSVDNLEISAAATGNTAVDPGRWRLVVDMSSRLNREVGADAAKAGADENGDDVNVFAVRAWAGDPGPEAVELEIFAESATPADEPSPPATPPIETEPAPAGATSAPPIAEPATAPVTEPAAAPVAEPAVAPVAEPAPSPPAPATDYQIGGGDVLKVEVFEDPRLSGEFTVGSEGSIVFPLLGEVSVRSMTAIAIQEKLAELLEADFLYDPHVSVTVSAYRSKKVQIQGMVRMPGIYYLEGPTRIFDLLSRAQGLLQAPGEIRAGQVARVVRAGGDVSLSIDLHELLVLGNDELNVALEDGDVVYVLRTEEVHVIGEVKRPGSFPYEDGMTVLKALSLAGGPTKRGAVKNAVVRRIQDGGEVRIKVAVEDLLLPDDILEIPLSFW